MQLGYKNMAGYTVLQFHPVGVAVLAPCSGNHATMLRRVDWPWPACGAHPTLTAQAVTSQQQCNLGPGLQMDDGPSASPRLNKLILVA